jgi:hypothetical protein
MYIADAEVIDVGYSVPGIATHITLISLRLL